MRFTRFTSKRSNVCHVIICKMPDLVLDALSVTAPDFSLMNLLDEFVSLRCG
jgi:hypothetical protein